MNGGPEESKTPTQDKIQYRKLSFDVVGCAQKVHRVLGPGFPESVYHKALCAELAARRIPFQSEQPAEVTYGGYVCGEFRMDIVVDGKIILELKALKDLHEEHTAQAISYLKATGLHLAILVNFGGRSLETRRVVM